MLNNILIYLSRIPFFAIFIKIHELTIFDPVQSFHRTWQAPIITLYYQ